MQRVLLFTGLLLGINLCSAEKVEVGPDGFLRIDGKPHFPIGMYSAARYEDMASGGFTATHSYAITTGEPDEPTNSTDARLRMLLDKNAINGLRMMVELPRKAIEKAKWDQVRHRIETFRNHPGLLCWGSEERVARGVAPLTNIVALYHLVHELDPNHPLVLGDTKDVIKKLQGDRRDFFPDEAMDIGIWWWYPIPLKDKDGNGVGDTNHASPNLLSPKAAAEMGRSVRHRQKILQPPSWLTTTWSKKPLWIAIQSYQHPSKDGRFPTPAEYRCMAYLSIINGVKGLWFYTGSGQKDYLGKPAGLFNKMEEGHWEYVKSLVHELDDFSPVIMAAQPKERITMSPAKAPIEFALRDDGKNLYLIAANKSPKSQTVKFTGNALNGKRAEVLFESHLASASHGKIKDTFEGFGVHIYRLMRCLERGQPCPRLFEAILNSPHAAPAGAHAPAPEARSAHPPAPLWRSKAGRYQAPISRQ